MSAAATLPSYETRDPRGWCGDPARGAALGRHSVLDADPEASIKLTLRRVRLDAGGYDALGTYWGHGDPIYWYASADGSIDATLRTPGRGVTSYERADAKAAIREIYPLARFHR